MLGKDADKNEYWFFKEDPGKLFVKKVEFQQLAEEEEKKEVVQINTEGIRDVEMAEETAPIQPRFFWAFYDEEEELERLIEACNSKGVRERKLQEGLRKIKDRLKLKRSKKEPKKEEG